MCLLNGTTKHYLSMFHLAIQCSSTNTLALADRTLAHTLKAPIVYRVLDLALSWCLQRRPKLKPQTSSQACPTFYRNENQQGDSFQMCSSGDVPDGWNDQASSFYIPAGYLVILYIDSGYNGQNIGPFGQGSSNLPVNFDKQLSSVIVSQPQAQVQVSTQNCPTFYRNENQQGDSFQMCSSGDVPNGWNDEAMYFYVPSGYSVQLYQETALSGQDLHSYTQGSYNVLTNGQVSSIIVSSTQAPTCPTFYRDSNQQGDSFQMCSSGEVPDGWNDLATSFYVPSGYSVQLYQDSGFSGQIGSYTQGSYNMPSYGQLSSVTVSSTQTQSQTQTSSLTCPTFYRDLNQQGDSFQLCSSGEST